MNKYYIIKAAPDNEYHWPLPQPGMHKIFAKPTHSFAVKDFTVNIPLRPGNSLV
jgi:hypothetical protein